VGRREGLIFRRFSLLRFVEKKFRCQIPCLEGASEHSVASCFTVATTNYDPISDKFIARFNNETRALEYDRKY
jgi:hypothetical protein